MATTTKYASVVVNLGLGLPSWVTDLDDQQRVAAYDGYQRMYDNAPGTFKVSMRGTEDKPVYIPSARKIVEATNRFLGKGWNWSLASVNPDVQVAEADRATLEATLAALFAREEMLAKFFSIKRNFLIKGDAFWHISADLGAVAGQRVSISEINPRSVFKIPHPTNEERMVGVYIVDLILADDGKTEIARRQEYRYNDDGTVFSRLTFWEANAWDDRWTGHPPLKPVETPEGYRADPNMALLLSGTTLPTSVTTIPVYHMRNNRAGGEPYGSSQIAGIETLIAAINQTVSDEDITLALQGLGVFVTDSTRPVDSQGIETDWVVAPGTVLEMKTGSTFQRIDGVKTVVPFQEHLGYLDSQLTSTSGLSATAIGNVDVQVAASGVALRLDMAPILAQNEEKEAELLSRMDQMLFDLLKMWMPVEGVSVPEGLQISNSFDDPLPIDRAGVIAEVTALVNAGLMSRDFAIKYLTAKLGYQFPTDMLLDILDEQDSIGARLRAEAAGGAVGTDEGTGDISMGAGGAAGSIATPAPVA